jgi:hypothetical protein
MDAALTVEAVAIANGLTEIAAAAGRLADETTKSPARMGAILGPSFARGLRYRAVRLSEEIAAVGGQGKTRDPFETFPAVDELRRAGKFYAKTFVC